MTKSEAQTRQEIIDKHLALAGWDVNDVSQCSQELDIDLVAAGVPRVAEPTSKYDNHQFADYALLHRGKPIAVVEAKKTSKDARVGKEQALKYSQNLQKLHGGDYPFIFFTNGYDNWFWEYNIYPPFKVHGYPTRDDLEWMQQRRESRKPMSVELINTDIAGRDYQIAGIRSILEGIEAKKQKFLLVMATGTGKTRTAAALFDVLIRARWAKRILFLVDRIALANQALEAFKEHIPSEPVYPKDGDKGLPKDRRIYVETYPTMLNLIQSVDSQRNYISPFFFDVIIADESHRSIYNTYRQVLDYFHAIKIGLTATPTDRIDHDTFSLFDCDQGQPTFAYTYEEAIQHVPPYLCDFEVLNVRSKFQIEGIRGETLTEEQQESLKLQGIDPDDVDFEGTDLEKKVTNSGTNAVIVREFMEECIKDSSGIVPGKSIFFCISKDHARRVEEVFNKLYPEYGGNLARVIVSEDRFAQDLLKQFKKNDFPRIAISVDMLDTGVDVREVVNLVFAKPVYSYVKFWQMIGRGTRVLDIPEKRNPWCKEKDKFLIIDCWANFEYFKLRPRGKEPGEQIPLPVRMFRTRIRQLEAAQKANSAEVIASATKALRDDIASLPKANVVVRESAKDLDAVSKDEFWRNLSKADLEFLRVHIAPVMRARSEVDFKAMRFEMEVVELSTALLEKNTDQVQIIRDSIVSQVSELPLSVNVVEAEQDLIEEIINPYNDWSGVSIDWLKSITKKIAPLMRYREGSPSQVMKLSLSDLTAEKKYIEFGPKNERMTTLAYREKVEQFIRELEANNPVIQKLKAGSEISPSEVKELAKLLESHRVPVTEELLRKVYDHKTASFVQFIQHILGLKKLESWAETVEAKFDEFLARHNTFGHLQIQFLQTLKTFILQNRKVERQNLVDRPFTQIHPNGIRGVFKPAEIDEVVDFIEQLVA
jgi:type I restriction enzyme R subunit